QLPHAATRLCGFSINGRLGWSRKYGWKEVKLTLARSHLLFQLAAGVGTDRYSRVPCWNLFSSHAFISVNLTFFKKCGELAWSIRNGSRPRSPAKAATACSSTRS